MESLSEVHDDSSRAYPSSVKSEEGNLSPEGDRSSPPPNCAICLEKCRNKSFADSCLHQFCFKCIVTWSKVKTECPLCKQNFKSIIHNVQSNQQYEEYRVEQHLQEEDRIEIDDLVTATRRTTLAVPNIRHSIELQRMFMHQPALLAMLGISGDQPNDLPGIVPPALPSSRHRRPSSFRPSVYKHNLWARPLPDFTGRHRDCTPEFYRYNDSQVHRLVPWLNRELHYLLLENASHITYVLSRILELLPQCHITSPEFRNEVYRWLGSRTDHFLHELHCFASTPYDLTGYDRNVQYTTDSRTLNTTNDVISSPDTESGDSDIVLVNPTAQRPLPAQPASPYDMNPGPSVRSGPDFVTPRGPVDMMSEAQPKPSSSRSGENGSKSLYHTGIMPPALPSSRHRRSPSSFRPTVYKDNLWARPLPDFTGRHRNCAPEFYRYNDSQMHRLVPWLNRELHYLLLENTGDIPNVLSRILELLPQCHITSPEFKNAVHRFFGSRTDHFLHELHCFASTPYDLTGYDRNVQYTTDSRTLNTTISSLDTESGDSDIVLVNLTEQRPPPARPALPYDTNPGPSVRSGPDFVTPRGPVDMMSETQPKSTSSRSGENGSKSFFHTGIMPPALPSSMHRRSPSSFRPTVYKDNLWARPLPDFTGRHRDCTPEFYRYNDSQMHRLVPWLNRELHYLLLENTEDIPNVLSRILELLPQCHITSPEFKNAVHCFFGSRTDHFLHELHCFASTPYDLTGYDRNVQYTTDSRTLNTTNDVISSPDTESGDSDIVLVNPTAQRPLPAQPASPYDMNPGPSVRSGPDFVTPRGPVDMMSEAQPKPSSSRSGENGSKSLYHTGIMPPALPSSRHRRSPSSFRPTVYKDNLWARPLPDFTGRHRNCAPEFYRYNDSQMHRLVPWLNRELHYLLLENTGDIPNVLSRILELLPQCHITSPEFKNAVHRFFGSRTDHFLHELHCFASTPYDLTGYDRNVQYTTDSRTLNTTISSLDTESGDSDIVLVNLTEQRPPPARPALPYDTNPGPSVRSGPDFVTPRGPVDMMSETQPKSTSSRSGENGSKSFFHTGIMPPALPSSMHRRSPSSFRPTVYKDNLWARPLPDFTGRHRDCTPEFYRYNDSQMHRLVPWLNRELHYLLLENTGDIPNVLSRILELLPQCHITSPEFKNAVHCFFGSRTDHFLHELHCFASTPYDLTGYDRNVQYTTDSRTLNTTNDVISSPDTESGDSDIVLVNPTAQRPPPAQPASPYDTNPGPSVRRGPDFVTPRGQVDMMSEAGRDM